MLYRGLIQTLGKLSIKSCIEAFFAASLISSKVAPFLATHMFYSMVSLNKKVS